MVLVGAGPPEPGEALLGTGDCTKVTLTASEMGAGLKGVGPRVPAGRPAGLTVGAAWGLMVAGRLMGTN